MHCIQDRSKAGFGAANRKVKEMNITIGSSHKSNSFKNIKARYLAAACGVALAATAVVAGQPWATATVSTTAPVRSVAVLPPAETPSTTLYLVAGEAEKLRVTDLFAADAAARPGHVSVEVIGSGQRSEASERCHHSA
jgi:hypothetical protein